MANGGVEALLSWLNSQGLSEQPLQIRDLQDGTRLLDVINKMTSEQVSSGHSVEERLSQIACFLERDCRFCGASPSWHDIANGVNLTTEISKVLLLLVYYDMMNSRCTINKMEFGVEREIANLTHRFVLEADGCVYLNNGFEAYLQRKYVPYVVPTENSDSSSPSTQSSSSLLSDDSPAFHHSQRVKFVDLHTVVTPRASTSPLQHVMNTPQFKLKRMQRQIIQEREYKDGLTRELASKIFLIEQGETQIKQLEYQLDKIKNDQDEREQFASDKLNQLESKNESLQSRLHELCRQNQDLKCNTGHMERKVDQLTEENGNLSVQVREICSQLVTSDTEVGRLMETQATVEMELHSKTSCLQAELSQATAQKDFQNEQILILQGKISVLEEQLCRVCKEEKGENMGPVMERALLENEIMDLKAQLEMVAGSLGETEQVVQAKEIMLAQYQEDLTLQKEVTKTEEEVQAKQQDLAQMQKDIAEQRQSLLQEMQNLQLQVDSTRALYKESQEKAQLKEEQMLQENTKQEATHGQQKTAYENQMAQLNEEIQQQQEKMDTLKKDGTGQVELLHQEIQTLRNRLETSSFSLTEAEEVVQTTEDLLAKQQLDSLAVQETLQEKIKMFQEEMQGLRVEVHGLQGQLECKTTSIRVAEEQIMAKEQQLAVIQQDKSEQVDLMQKCVAASEEEVEKLKEIQKAKDDLFLQSKEEVENLKAELSTIMASSAEKDKQLDGLREEVSVQVDKVKLAREEIQVKEDLLTNFQMEGSHQTDVRVCEIRSLEVQVETITTTLSHTKRELKTQQDICSKHQQDNAQRLERLQEQLTAKTEAAEHYKSQMEKAMCHYNGKKQLLEESREQVAATQHSLDVKDQEMKAIATELKLLQLDLDNVKSSEEKLLNRVASLESQTCELKMEKEDGADSLEDDTLEDSLNTTRRPSAPGKSSTPLFRSSERLAAKRRPSAAESLESLYFTPLAKNSSTKRHMDNSPSSSLAELALDSTRKNGLTSSVKRRRTTQVISITMSKTPGRGGPDHHRHGDEEDHNNSFYSLMSARSQPNLSSSQSQSQSQKQRPVSLAEPGGTPAGKTADAASDQLLSLPGYRRSTTHSTAPPRSTSTFCVGAEYEPDNGPNDWMRIAELQARNKACLPHLKSTYPLESRPSIGPELSFTEDDLRMGDPTDTIRRATMMPGQLQDSLTSHRLSYMGTSDIRPHRHSLMPGQLSTRTASCTQLTSSPHQSKHTATSSQHLYPCSPEGKVKASCFPRPLTPKNNRTALSPRSVSQVQRRESTVFTIDNTPKKSYIQKGLNKLRSSTRKSPGKSLKTPATPTNPPTGMGTPMAKRGSTTRAAPQRAAEAGTKGQRRSPRTGSITAKNPGLTASARKGPGVAGVKRVPKS